MEGAEYMPFKRYMEKLSEEKIKEALVGKHRRYTGYTGIVVTAFAAMIGFYHLYTAYAGPPFAILFRNLHWMMLASLLFILFPARADDSLQKSSRWNWLFCAISLMLAAFLWQNWTAVAQKIVSGPSMTEVGIAVLFLIIITEIARRTAVWDLLCVTISLVLGFYLWFNWTAIAARAGSPTAIDVIFGILLVLMVIEAARRTVGWPIILVAFLFLIYAYFGPAMPGLLIHRGYSISRIFSFLYLTDAGIFGIPLGVSARFIVLFIIFGAFLDRSGAGIFFRDLSLAVTGKYVGGPAKAAIIFSALIGSITGSSTANVATTGTFTIPLMKKLGYPPELAAGVEADASTGGQILPPVMGASAFVMAEFINMPYSAVMVAAALPAFMYFSTSFFMIHYRAMKEGLVGLPKSDLPALKEVLKGGFYYFAPLIMLIIMLFRFSPGRSVFWAIILTVVLSWFKKETRMYPKDIFTTMAEGVIKSLEVVAACAVAGIVIGMVTMTGLGLKFSTIITTMAGGVLWKALPLTMIASLILGMGVPTTAKYIILATLVAPALVTMGAPLLPAHLFILYFGTDADITPPVGLAAYAAAGIAGADPLKTGWEAMKMGITAYIVPFMIIYRPAIILNAPLPEILFAFVTILIGGGVLGAAVQGYFIRRMPAWHRLVAGAGAILLLDPHLYMDLIGAALVGFIVVLEYRAKRQEEALEAQV